MKHSGESLVAPGFNPASQIERFRLQPRQRYLDDVELAQLGTALAEAEARSSEDPFAIAAIRLLLLTGCRRDEILDARWDWIDMQRGLLMLPDSKTGAKSVLLNFGAVEVLQKLTRVPLALGADHNLPYVFDSFRYQGRIEDDLTPDLLDTPEPREDELPLYQSLVTFPAP